MQREQIEQGHAWTQLRTFATAWFDPQNIFARTGWKQKVNQTQPEEASQ
jgi:hypothetical protein